MSGVPYIKPALAKPHEVMDKTACNIAGIVDRLCEVHYRDVPRSQNLTTTQRKRAMKLAVINKLKEGLDNEK